MLKECITCGKTFEIIVRTSQDKRRKNCSDKCISKSKTGEGNPAYSHGHSKRGQRSREYSIWAGMKARAYANDNYHKKYYKDIDVCDRWMNSFESFLDDMGECPEGCTLDRIDNKGDYEPSNCRWATHKQQMANTRRTVNINAAGKVFNMSEWTRILGFAPGKLSRLKAQGCNLDEFVEDFIRRYNLDIDKIILHHRK